MVSRLPFFDHVSLLALRDGRGKDRSQEADIRRPFRLRLLIAAHCQNTTPPGLVEALKSFSNLTYLDLSDTSAARDQTVLAKLGDLSLLQVLKVRNVHLKDDDLALLAQGVGTRVRSLDISQNHLTDRSVGILLKHCFLDDSSIRSSAAGRRYNALAHDMEDWPAGIVEPDLATLDEFRDESYDRRFVQRLTSHIVSRLPFEDLPDSGITHLNIADNDISTGGFAALVKTGKLFSFNAGTPNFRSGTPSNDSGSRSSTKGNVAASTSDKSVETVIPFLARCARDMTFLRIHHTIVTVDAPLAAENLHSTISELGGDQLKSLPEAEGSPLVEAHGTGVVSEVDSEEPAPRYELPGDMMRFEISPAIGDKPELASPQLSPDPKRGSVFAPEVAPPPANDDATVILTATGFTSPVPSYEAITKAPRSVPAEPSGQLETIAMKIRTIQSEREHLRKLQTSGPHGLAPALMPKLRSIILTDVPPHTSTTNIVDTLITFIKYCAKETHLASLEASLNQRSIHTLGSRRHMSMHRQRACEIFDLRRIVLEMASDDLGHNSITSGGSHRHRKFRTSGSNNRTKSSTEDADSEAFWSASENDFTFFDDEEECGLPAAETAQPPRIPLASISEKIALAPSQPGESEAVSMTDPSGQRQQQQSTRPQSQNLKLRTTPTSLPRIDVVAELAKFRRERKAAFDRLQAAIVHESVDAFVEGYWPGEIKVVKAQRLLSSSTDGMIDYYGNFFERGWAYR